MIGSISFHGNSLFLSCNLVGQFCLSDPGNSSRTIIFVSLWVRIKTFPIEYESVMSWDLIMYLESASSKMSANIV